MDENDGLAFVERLVDRPETPVAEPMIAIAGRYADAVRAELVVGTLT